MVLLKADAEQVPQLAKSGGIIAHAILPKSAVDLTFNLAAEVVARLYCIAAVFRMKLFKTIMPEQWRKQGNCIMTIADILRTGASGQPGEPQSL